jgi:hypothetical protein
MENTIFNEILAYVFSIGAIAALWALFYKIASPKILVDINEGSISFKSDKAQISLKPLLHISKLSIQTSRGAAVKVAAPYFSRKKKKDKRKKKKNSLLCQELSSGALAGGCL